MIKFTSTEQGICIPLSSTHRKVAEKGKWVREQVEKRTDSFYPRIRNHFQKAF